MTMLADEPHRYVLPMDGLPEHNIAMEIDRLLARLTIVAQVCVHRIPMKRAEALTKILNTGVVP